MAESAIEAGLATAATDPKKVKIDNREAESHSISELIEADKYLAQKAAGRLKTAIKWQTISPPGCVR